MQKPKLKPKQPIRILVAADWHTDYKYFGQEELDKMNNADFDVCLSAGDIPADGIRLLKNICKNKPLYAVAGNHDEWDTPEKGGAVNIHLETVKISGWKIVGISGTAKYKEGNHPMMSDMESIHLCRRLPKADILLTHDSMYHLFEGDGSHRGLKGFDLYNILNHPTVNICGHYHKNAVKYRYKVPTVCVYQCVIITLPDFSVKKLF